MTRRALAMSRLVWAAANTPAVHLYAPPGGGFSVRFPGVPEEATGATTVTATYTTPDGNTFSAGYTDAPVGTEADVQSEHERVRFVRRGDRLYRVAVAGTSAFVASRDAAEFLDSFELTK